MHGCVKLFIYRPGGVKPVEDLIKSLKTMKIAQSPFHIRPSIHGGGVSFQKDWECEQGMKIGPDGLILDEWGWMDVRS